MIKRRYFQDLWVGDDYDVCEETEYLVDCLRIADRIMDEKLTFDDCYALFETAHDKYTAKRARFKGAHERLEGIRAARRKRLEATDRENSTLPNPIRSLTSIYARTLAKANAQSAMNDRRYGFLKEDG